MKMKYSLLLMCLLILGLQTAAQDVVSLKCGDVVEGELSKQSVQFQGYYGDDRWADIFPLDMRAGTKINLTVEPLGSTFNPSILLQDSGGNDVLFVNAGLLGETERLNDYQIGSNQLVILGVKPDYEPKGNNATDINHYYNWGEAGRYLGAYEIRLGCTLRDGTVIEPGESADAPAGGAQSAPSAFTGVGFPGLAPVDFSAMARLPLPLGLAMSGAVTPTGNEILGYTFEATEGDTLNLSFSRISGNLNIGLVVVLGDNQVVYQSSLINTQTMNAIFTAPATGGYAVSMYRIDLLPPATPEATAFQIEVIVE